MKTLFATLFFLVVPFLTTQAQSKVAHIDTQELMSEMPEVIAVKKELEKLQKTFSTELENSIKEFQAKQQSYAADAENQTEVINQKRVRDLEQMQQGIQQYRENAAQELQKKQAEMMRPLFEKVKAAIEKVATAKGFDYVLDASVGGSVIMAKGRDLLSDVKKELGF